MLLAIDTATSACSVALIDGDVVVASAHEIVGRGHAEMLIPMIASLPCGGKASEIIVSCGPGSFTGVRVGIAAARALALGWSASVHGCPTLALIAARGFAEWPDLATLTVATEGGHGELFVESYARDGLMSIRPLGSYLPAAALEQAETHIAGNAAHRLVDQRGSGTALAIEPSAADVLALPPTLRSLPPSPIYGRAPDAKPKVA